MNRFVAKNVHVLVNGAYLLENSRWESGFPVLDRIRHGVQSVPLDTYEVAKHIFFDANQLLAVNGESVVVKNGEDKVDKVLLRYPREMTLDTFRDRAEDEVNSVISHLSGIALPTEVSIKKTRVFRAPLGAILAVTQTQERLDLAAYPGLDWDVLREKPLNDIPDTTAKSIERLLVGSLALWGERGYYPDVFHGGGNLRLSAEGRVILIDVLPIYENGGRLVGDKPWNALDYIEQNLREFAQFVGRYGA